MSGRRLSATLGRLAEQLEVQERDRDVAGSSLDVCWAEIASARALHGRNIARRVAQAYPLSEADL